MRKPTSCAALLRPAALCAAGLVQFAGVRSVHAQEESIHEASGTSRVRSHESSRDARGIFDARPDNVFVVKMKYGLNL